MTVLHPNNDYKYIDKIDFSVDMQIVWEEYNKLVSYAEILGVDVSSHSAYVLYRLSVGLRDNRLSQERYNLRNILHKIDSVDTVDFVDINKVTITYTNSEIDWDTVIRLVESRLGPKTRKMLPYFVDGTPIGTTAKIFNVTYGYTHSVYNSIARRFRQALFALHYRNILF